MKTKYLLLLFCAVLFLSCEDNLENELNFEENSITQEIDMSDFYLRTDEQDVQGRGISVDTRCYSMNNLNRQLDENPGLYNKMYNLEYRTRQFINAKGKPPGTPGGGGDGGDGGGDGGDGGGGTPSGIIDFNDPIFSGNIIPVVFHVIYNRETENIGDIQLEQQIDALNKDFNLNNPLRGTIPSEFALVESNVGLSFKTAGIIRVKSGKKSWRPNDEMKFTSTGGSDAITPQRYLNIWVVNNMPYRGGNILGYAQFPEGDWATDGVVLDRRFVGETQYSTGRTATHEVGHWLNLRHIWGDGGCSASDFVSDTPDSDRYNTGCPTYPTVHCGSADMTMNFMDYSDDTCLNMFTDGQKVRMEAVFAPGNFRDLMNISL